MLQNAFGKVINRLPENNRIERIWKLAELDFKKRYYNDNLGVLWSLLEPLFRIGIYYFIFKVVLNVAPVENYALFIFSGILFWGLFIQSINSGKALLKRKRYLIENITIQKIDLYLSNSLSNLLTFLMTFIVYSIIAYIVGVHYNLSIFYLLILILNVVLLSIGGGMILAVLYIYVKDIDHLWDIIRLFLFWTSGVFMRGEKMLEDYPFLLFLNPLISILENVRNVIFKIKPIDFDLLVFGLTYGIIIFLLGNFLFNRFSEYALERY